MLTVLGVQGKGWDDGDRAQNLIAKVEKAGFTNRVAFSAFTHENLVPFKLIAPDIPTCLLYAAFGLCHLMIIPCQVQPRRNRPRARQRRNQGRLHEGLANPLHVL